VHEKLLVYWFIIGEFAVSTLLIGYHMSCHMKISFLWASVCHGRWLVRMPLECSESLPNSHLSHSTWDKLFVGHSNDSMSVLDDTLVVNDVCSMFGSHIKYLVQLQLTVQDAPQSSQTLRNAFTILMSGKQTNLFKRDGSDLDTYFFAVFWVVPLPMCYLCTETFVCLLMNF